MKREKLERLIIDASDGELNARQLRLLEEELQNHPDLLKDYRAILNLPELAQLYEEAEKSGQYRASIHSIKENIRELKKSSESFETVSLEWFRRYALAASIAIFAVTSVFSFIQMQDSQIDSEMIAEEYFYPVNESAPDNYVLYLEEIAEE